MAVPNFLNSSFRYKSTLGVTDVNTIIADLDSELTALGWTDLGGVGTGPWKSPDRADGAFLKITCARLSATRIQYVCVDHVGLNTQGANAQSQQDIDVAGNTIGYFTGEFHVVVDSWRLSATETFGVGMLDQTPEPFANPRPAYWNWWGPRDGNGNTTARIWSNCYTFWPGQTGYVSGPSGFPVGLGRAHHLTSPGSQGLTLSGALRVFPMEFGPSGWWMGRAFQMLLIDTTISMNSEVVIPIDSGTTGTFKVCGRWPTLNMYVAIRKA